MCCRFRLGVRMMLRCVVVIVEGYCVLVLFPVFFFSLSLSVFVLSSSLLFFELLVLVRVKYVASVSSYVDLFRYLCCDLDLVYSF